MKVEIETPIKRMEFDGANYKLIILDAKDTYHYFCSDGSYDGWSRDCTDNNCVTWMGEKVRCDICNYTWVGVFPAECERLECPNCHNMATFELI